ncbi:unnamed protein product, partial [Vitis vinifera]
MGLLPGRRHRSVITGELPSPTSFSAIEDFLPFHPFFSTIRSAILLAEYELKARGAYWFYEHLSLPICLLLLLLLLYVAILLSACLYHHLV